MCQFHFMGSSSVDDCNGHETFFTDQVARTWRFSAYYSKVFPVFIKRTTVIIDCFEVFIDRPSNLLAWAQIFSSYKHHNTVKVLIGITPQGTISFVSKAWGGRTSDKFLTENWWVMEKLLPGDLVMADRGFTIHESLVFKQTQLAIPAFPWGKDQLGSGGCGKNKRNCKCVHSCWASDWPAWKEEHHTAWNSSYRLLHLQPEWVSGDGDTND